MYKLNLRLGECHIQILSKKELDVAWESAPFVVQEEIAEPDYCYTLCEVEQIEEPTQEECLQWGQWWIYRPGQDEIHVRRMDDSGIPYMKCFSTGEKEYCVEYILALDKLICLDRFLLSFMALESRMLAHNALILHSSFVEYKGYGILFSAPSGTGKTTQAELWKKYRDCRIINGDRALLQKGQDGFLAYGWPVCGSSNISENTVVPIKAIVQLEQSSTNVVGQEDTITKFHKLIPEITVNRWNMDAYQKSLDLMEALIAEVPIVHFCCNMEEDAVDVLEQYLFGDENGVSK